MRKVVEEIDRTRDRERLWNERANRGTDQRPTDEKRKWAVVFAWKTRRLTKSTYVLEVRAKKALPKEAGIVIERRSWRHRNEKLMYLSKE